ncbi:MAG: hypothetical protein DMD58_14190 [Gemmatimonadetes bacterium]|nr:MAG: hypothetical protein DMD58_14190 [Gemmatimonadota bacterium]
MAGSRAAAAMPSSSVDFPDPFSPTKNVTQAFSWSRSNDRMAGTVNGKASSSPRRRLMDARCVALTGSNIPDSNESPRASVAELLQVPEGQVIEEARFR